jgi:hypothetical protein
MRCGIVPIVAAAAVSMAPGSRCPVLRLSLQQAGRLRFGAAQGPPSWNTDRDGPWSPGYWVELEGGPNHGRTLVVTMDSIDSGLKEGDWCGVESLDDIAQLRCVALPDPEATASAITSRLQNGDRSRAAIQDVLRATTPIATMLVTVLAVGFLFARFAPQPSIVERQQRCEQLISGSVSVGDRQGAEAWLSTCDLSRTEADEVLFSAWTQRWQSKEPPLWNQPLDVLDRM